MDGLTTITERPDLRAQFSEAMDPLPPVRRRSRLGSALRRRRGFLLFVLLPTLLVTGYYFGIAADQFESEARFSVRSSAQSGGSSVSGIGQLLGMGTGLNPAQAESFSVGDYLESHDAVAALRERLPLIDMFRRPEADMVAKLWWPDPTAEGLLRYYHRQVKIAYNGETGITTLRVQAFRPDDSRKIAEVLLELGESRVNDLNRRAVADTLRVARQEVETAEERVAQSQRKLTEFRIRQQNINPEKTSSAQLALVGLLQSQLAQARAQQTTMGASIRTDSPQYVALSRRIAAIENQVAVESAKLTGANNAMAPVLADYEQLTLRQEFARTSYTAAQATLENAKQAALKQQLFVVRVVEPNLAEKALYPRGILIVSSVFAIILVLYCIGLLVVAGVREHTA